MLRASITTSNQITPSLEELEAARILSLHFNTSIEFILPHDTYKQKTPDIIMRGISWEIKTPTGSSYKTTIRKQIRKALKQSPNIIINLGLIKINEDIAIKQLHKEVSINRKILNLLVITKSKKVVTVYRKK